MWTTAEVLQRPCLEHSKVEHADAFVFNSSLRITSCWPRADGAHDAAGDAGFDVADDQAAGVDGAVGNVVGTVFKPARRVTLRGPRSWQSWLCRGLCRDLPWPEPALARADLQRRSLISLAQQVLKVYYSIKQATLGGV